jgi:transposase
MSTGARTRNLKRPAVAAAKGAPTVTTASTPQLELEEEARPPRRKDTPTLREGKVADVSLPGEPDSGPSHSEMQVSGTQEETSAMRSVALDLALRKISYCEIEAGQVLVRRTVTALDSLKDLLGPGCSPAKVAIEACREAWHVHAELTSWGNEVLLVDTTRVRQLGVGAHGRKTDRIDAEILARAVEKGGLPKAHLLSKARQRLRLELSVRRALVETRAQYITTLRGLARTNGVRLASCDTKNFVANLRKTNLDPVLRELTGPIAQVLEQVDAALARSELRIQSEVEKDQTIQLLMTVPNVSVIIAAVFVSVIDDAHRFRDAHQVGAYLGLVPSEKSSGEKRRLGSITKQGNSYARATLMQASWGLMRLGRSDDPLQQWANAVARRRGKFIAAVALARRLAGILWAMWRNDTVYDAARVGTRSAAGLEQQAQDISFRATAMKNAAQKARQRARKLKLLEMNP